MTLDQALRIDYRKHLSEGEFRKMVDQQPDLQAAYATYKDCYGKEPTLRDWIAWVKGELE